MDPEINWNSKPLKIANLAIKITNLVVATMNLVIHFFAPYAIIIAILTGYITLVQGLIAWAVMASWAAIIEIQSALKHMGPNNE